MRRQGPFSRIAKTPYRMSRRASRGLWILIRKGASPLLPLKSGQLIRCLTWMASKNDRFLIQMRFSDMLRRVCRHEKQGSRVRFHNLGTDSKPTVAIIDGEPSRGCAHSSASPSRSAIQRSNGTPSNNGVNARKVNVRTRTLGRIRRK
jgi:hypothetical protein